MSTSPDAGPEAGPEAGPGAASGQRGPTITVGGRPGTGTSTLCRTLRDRLGIPYTYAGQIFREQAASHGMDLATFGHLCQEDPAVDQELDRRQVELLRKGPLILEGRLSGILAAKNAVPALKVWLICAPEERIRRIVERDGGTAEDQAAATQEREASEADRYRRYYGIDLQDLGVYDLVLDSTHRGPDELADDVLARL